jgi:hypothetical protein
LRVRITLDRLPGGEDKGGLRTFRAVQALLEAAGRAIGSADAKGESPTGESRVGEVQARATFLSLGPPDCYEYEVEVTIDQPETRESPATHER